MEPKTFDAQVFQKCSPSSVNAYKSFPGFRIFKNVLAAIPAVIELVSDGVRHVIWRSDGATAMGSGMLFGMLFCYFII